MANFQIEDKIGKSKYFQKIFLIANIKVELVIRILFFKLNITDVLFSNKTLM